MLADQIKEFEIESGVPVPIDRAKFTKEWWGAHPEQKRRIGEASRERWKSSAFRKAHREAQSLWIATCEGCHVNGVEYDPTKAFQWRRTLLCADCFGAKYSRTYTEERDDLAELSVFPDRAWKELSGEQLLAAAVIERAAQDLATQDTISNLFTDYRARLDAWRWIHGRNGAELTFALCCEALALEESATRDRIKKLMAIHRGCGTPQKRWPMWSEDVREARPAAYDYDQGPELNALLGETWEAPEMADIPKLVLRRGEQSNRGLRVNFMLDGTVGQKMRILLAQTGETLPDLCEKLIAFAVEHVEFDATPSEEVHND